MKSSCTRAVSLAARQQRGISLIEALISLLLISIMGAGLAMISSRSMLTQRYVTTQNLAVLQMREHIKTAKPGDSLALGFGEEQLPVAYELNTVDVSVNNPVAERTVNVYLQRKIAAESEDWLGGSISIGPES